MCYKNIALSYMHLKKFYKSKNTLAKMLACALNENDYSNELFAYDYMGV